MKRKFRCIIGFHKWVNTGKYGTIMYPVPTVKCIYCNLHVKHVMPGETYSYYPERGK